MKNECLCATTSHPQNSLAIFNSLARVERVTTKMAVGIILRITSLGVTTGPRHSEGGIGFLRCRGCATLGYYGSDTAAMSHSTVGKGRRRGGVTITEADITSSRYNSWETVGMVTDEIRRRNKTQSEEEKLSTTGTKSDMIRTLLIDDEKGGGCGGDSGKPSARGRQMRTDRGAGSSGSARNKTTNDSNKENVGPSSRTTRSRSNDSASNTKVAATKAKPAAAETKKTGASGDAWAGDVISVAADGQGSKQVKLAYRS